MERPYLPIPAYKAEERIKVKKGGGGSVMGPPPERQAKRLGKQFDDLLKLLKSEDSSFSDTADSLAPDKTIVFEVAGAKIADFAKVASRIGFKFLIEDEFVIDPSEDFYVLDKGVPRLDKVVPVCFYMAMPSDAALRQMVLLWWRYKNGQALGKNNAPWKHLFDRLYNIRPWSLQDRIVPEDLNHFRDVSQHTVFDEVNCEIELWFSANKSVFDRNVASIENALGQIGGRLLAKSNIAEIRYQALLVSLPNQAMQSLANLDDSFRLLNMNEIMYIRPQSVASITDIPEDATKVVDDFFEEIDVTGTPLAALLDGYPVENHNLLRGRLIIDDPENLGSRYASLSSREHGTSIASLMIHGDAGFPKSTIGRKIYLRPVLCCDEIESRERFPQDVLLIDTIYLAVRRMFESTTETEEPSAPTVKIINLSLGDERRPFMRRMSPWARLLDWLSWKYKVLFIVSAGNINQSLWLSCYDGIIQFEDADRYDLETKVVEQLSYRYAPLLSPSESINALTIGAHHDDGVTKELPSTHHDPFVSRGMPSVISRLGLGYRGTIKPELLMCGGKVHVTCASSSDGVELRPASREGHYSGIGAAIPDNAGRLDKIANFSSTSAAAALASHRAHLIIEDLIASDLVEDNDELASLYAKALLVHHSKIHPDTYSRLKQVLGTGSSDPDTKRQVARFLGFGAIDHEFSHGGAPHRATLVGGAFLRPDMAHTYSIPCPVGLDGYTGWRSVTVTAAWLCPIDPGNQIYRGAKLEVSLANCLGASSDKVDQIYPQARGKGTVYHTKIEGKGRCAVETGDTFSFTINCLNLTGDIDEHIPYAVAVSVEIGAESQIDIHEQIYQALRISIR